jgi:hypothetical protein
MLEQPELHNILIVNILVNEMISEIDGYTQRMGWSFGCNRMKVRLTQCKSVRAHSINNR